MNVSLTPHLEELVRRKVETGLYNNASEVVREALRLLDNRDLLQSLRASNVEAERELDRGEGEEWPPELMERLRHEGDEMYRQGLKPDPEVCPENAARTVSASAARH